MPNSLRADRVLQVALLVGAIVGVACALGAATPSAPGARLTGDEPHYLLTAISLAEDGDLDIADELAAGRRRAFHALPLEAQGDPLPDGRRVSPHDPLLPLLLVPAAVAGGWVAAKLTMAALAGALAAVLVWTGARRLGVPLRAAATATGVLCLSPPLAVYGTQLYPELPAALAVTAAVALLTGRLEGRARWAVAALVVALPWLSAKYAPVALALAGLALSTLIGRGDRRAALALGAALVAAGVAYLALHQALYGGWTAHAAGDQFAAGELGVMGEDPDLAGRLPRLAALGLDAHYGLAAWQPAWLLAVPALAALARRRPGWWPVACLPTLAGWLTATLAAATMHGWWWPGRHALVALPGAALAVAWWVGDTPRRRRLLLASGAVGAAAYLWFAVAGAAGWTTWVVGPANTAYLPHLALRLVLPDAERAGAADWLLGAAWLLALGAAAVAAWRAPGVEGTAPGHRDAGVGTGGG